MVRVVLYLLLAILIITLLRSIIGVAAKALGAAFDSKPAPRSPKSEAQMGGELKRDPVCGTYVSAATSIRTISAGQTVYFCSPACREKFLNK